MAKQDWMSEGLCTSLSPEEADKIFFIGPGQTSKRARMYCQSCPVKQQCNQFAITYNEVGVWAGKTETDRRELDPFIREGLRTAANKKNQLESRNVNDFLPQAIQQSRETVQESRLLSERLDAALVRSEQLAAQLEALTHPFEQTNVPQVSGL